MHNVEHRASAPYGFICVNDALLPFLPEQRILIEARQMLDDGLFLRGVVRAFRMFGYVRRDGRPFSKGALRSTLRRAGISADTTLHESEWSC